MGDHMFVVTGGPGSGKTSLIEALARKGLWTVPESGRAIIRDQVGKGGDALPWADRAAYAALMAEQDLRAFDKATAQAGPVIHDRGIPDVIGYLALCGLPVPARLERAAARNRYNDTVFVAPFWEAIYARDEERRQDRHEAKETCRIMEDTYRRLGYRLLSLPLADIEQRAAFVLRHIRS